MAARTANAFILSTGADTGGAAIRVTEAFAGPANAGPRLRKGLSACTFCGASQGEPCGGGTPDLNPDCPVARPPWTVRSMVSASNYIAYPHDLPWNQASLERHYDEADVVILNNTLHGHDWYDEGQGRPTILMHHGLHRGHFNKEIEEIVAEARDIGAFQIGSTVNLELFGPIVWAPIPYPIEKLARMRVALWQRHPQEVIRIGHAPTDRAIKSTTAIIEAVDSLKEDGWPVELVLIEGKTNAETLEIKARQIDIYVDQLKLGYGCNAIEAWAMGIPVIAGVSEHLDWRRHMISRFESAGINGMPFLEAAEDTVFDVLRVLLGSRSLYDELSIIGRDHVKRWHREEAVVRLLSGIYDEVRSHQTKPGSYARSRRLHRRNLPHRERLAVLREARAERIGARQTT